MVTDIEKTKQDFMHNYYTKNKEALNKANSIYKKQKGIVHSPEMKKTYSKTNSLIRKGLIVEQNNCCLCGRTNEETRLLNHHAAGYSDDFSAYAVMRLCYSCHSKLHWKIRKQQGA